MRSHSTKDKMQNKKNAFGFLTQVRSKVGWELMSLQKKASAKGVRRASLIQAELWVTARHPAANYPCWLDQIPF